MLCYVLHVSSLVIELAHISNDMQIEDRPIVKEVKTYVREHHPIEKEFVVETRPTGMWSAAFVVGCNCL